MLSHTLLSLSLGLALTACSGDEPTAASLIGTWAPQSAQLGGQDFPIVNFEGSNLRLTADTYEFAGDRGSYFLVNTSTPTRLDIAGKEGPNAGRTIQGIYELSGDQLTVCYQLGVGERPFAFVSPADSMIFLVRYQRVP